jgi:hypothetical protein
LTFHQKEGKIKLFRRIYEMMDARASDSSGM